MTADNTIGNKESERVKRHIIIGMVGPTGSGKSTLSQELGKRWGVETVEEKFGENPFLVKFYKEPREYSYKSQLWFLEQKMAQLAGLDTSRVNIIDPALEMDLLYAETHRRLGWMAENEWAHYKMAFTTLRLQHNIILPDISVVVNARPEILLERIRNRGRKAELIMLDRYPEYFIKLGEVVTEWTAKTYPPKIVFDAGYFDFTPGGIHNGEVLGRIEGWAATYVAMGRKHALVDLVLPAFKSPPYTRDTAIIDPH